jgi:putative tricarboxylic transport membrane protein
LQPGPLLFESQKDLVWGLIASLYVGNVILLILNLPLIGIWVTLLQIPYRLLFPGILVFMSIGVYSLSNNPFDMLILGIFGVVGMVCLKLEMEMAPLALGVVLGPLMEENLRRAMLLSRGDPTVFFTKPISAGFMAASILLLGMLSLPFMRKKSSASPGRGDDAAQRIVPAQEPR